MLRRKGGAGGCVWRCAFRTLSPLMGVWLYYTRQVRIAKAGKMDGATIAAFVSLAMLGAGVGAMVRALLGLYVVPWPGVPPCSSAAWRRSSAAPAKATNFLARQAGCSHSACPPLKCASSSSYRR